MTTERLASDNITPIIDKYKDKISIDDYKKLLDLVKETGDYQVELLELLNKATTRVNDLEEEQAPLVEGWSKVMKLLSDLGNLIDKSKKEF